MCSIDRKRTTTDASISVSSEEYSLTIGPDGPIMLHDTLPDRAGFSVYSGRSDGEVTANWLLGLNREAQRLI